MMLTIILSDRSRLRVESCPVPIMTDFAEWRVYVHNPVTEDGIDESRWVATEARTGHLFPGSWPSSDRAALGAMAQLRKWGRNKAALRFIGAKNHLRRLNIEYPVNEVGGTAPTVKCKPRPTHDARLWRVLEVLRSGASMTIGDIAKALPNYTRPQIQSSVQRLRSLRLVGRIGPWMSSRYAVREAMAA